MRVLIVSNSSSTFITGAPIRTENIARNLSRTNEIWLLALHKGSQDEEQSISRYRAYCRRVISVREELSDTAFARPLDLLRYIAVLTPPDLRFNYSGELMRTLAALVRQERFDVVQLEGTGMGIYIDAIPEDLRHKTVWMLHDIDWSKFAGIAQVERRLRRKARAWIHSQMLRKWQPSQAARFGKCIVVSETDRRLLLEANHRLDVEVVPNGVDTRKNTLMSQNGLKPSLIFVGDMEYAPNADAAIYFCLEVLPLIRSQLPSAEIWIVGTSPRDEVNRLQSDGIHVTGRVADLRDYYHRSVVSVVPIRAGGGTRLKILEAMAFGRPVVSSSKGCEGLEVINGEHLLIADNPQQFAHETIRLLTSESLRRQLVIKARKLVSERYDWAGIADHLEAVYLQISKDSVLSQNPILLQLND